MSRVPPPLYLSPGDPLTASAWVDMQHRLRSGVHQHRHAGGGDGPALPGTALRRDSVVRAASAQAGRLILAGQPGETPLTGFLGRLPTRIEGNLRVHGAVEVQGSLRAGAGSLPIDRLPSATATHATRLFDPALPQWHRAVSLDLDLRQPTLVLLVSRWSPGGEAPARHSVETEAMPALPVSALALRTTFADQAALARWSVTPDADEARRTGGEGQPAVSDAGASWLMEAVCLPAGRFTVHLELWPAEQAATTATITSILS